MKRYSIYSPVIILLSAVVFTSGCGSNSSHQTSAILEEDDLEILASIEGGLGSAQGAVEIIPVPQIPQHEIDALDLPVVDIEPHIEPTQQQAPPVVEVANPDPQVLQTVADKLGYEEKVQVALSRAGLYSGEIDGKIGSGTREAIKTFQKNNGLKADGLVGPATWSKLRDYYYRSDE